MTKAAPTNQNFRIPLIDYHLSQLCKLGSSMKAVDAMVGIGFCSLTLATRPLEERHAGRILSRSRQGTGGTGIRRDTFNDCVRKVFQIFPFSKIVG
jgi:hypothetical protein